MIIVKFLPIFKKWFEKQTKEVRQEIISAVNRISQDNTSSLKALKAGIIEIKIHFGA
jgi:putative component of toxin-antitoxin plasmid stabilization module